MAIIGGVFAHIETWEYVGWGIWVVAGVTLGFLIYSVVKEKEFQLIQEEHYHLAEITKLDAAKTTTKVVIDKTSLTGYMAQSFNGLEIAPAKIKQFAHAVTVEGRKMTIREWTPLKKGKTFSDGEWRRLIAFMKQPDWEDKRIRFIVPINVNNENDGYELTAMGRQWLTDVLAETVLTPVSP